MLETENAKLYLCSVLYSHTENVTQPKQQTTTTALAMLQPITHFDIVRRPGFSPPPTERPTLRGSWSCWCFHPFIRPSVRHTDNDPSSSLLHPSSHPVLPCFLLNGPLSLAVLVSLSSPSSLGYTLCSLIPPSVPSLAPLLLFLCMSCFCMSSPTHESAPSHL